MLHLIKFLKNWDRLLNIFMYIETVTIINLMINKNSIFEIFFLTSKEFLS